MRIAAASLISLIAPFFLIQTSSSSDWDGFSASVTLVLLGFVLGLIAGRKHIRIFWLWPILSSIGVGTALALAKAPELLDILHACVFITTLVGFGTIFTVLCYKCEDDYYRRAKNKPPK